MARGEVVLRMGDGPTHLILLIEDDVLVRFSIAEILREKGYVAMEAAAAQLPSRHTGE